MRVIVRIFGVLAVIALGGALGMILYGLAEARRDPVVHHASLPLADWPADARPVRAVLLSDIHFGNATMGPTRFARIVSQVEALRPDIVLIAGDFVAGHDAQAARNAAADLAAGLSRLHAPLGVVAVLGNHDHWSDADLVRRTLMAANVTLVSNAAVQRGPLVIGGVDDLFSQHDDMSATLSAMAGLRGAKIMMAHTPDVARDLRGPKVVAKSGMVPPQVILAGHSHCGQVILPLFGQVKTVIDPREHYGCGTTRRGADRIVVTGGLGTSEVPIRIGAPPDLWVITLGPAASSN